MPTWLLTVLLSLATYRLTRLVVKDDFPPVLWLRDRMVGGWRPLTSGESARYTAAIMDIGAPAWMKSVENIDFGESVGPQDARYIIRARWVPDWFADLLSCPWCASGWVALGLTVGAAFTVGVPAPVLVWPAVWGAGALLASRKWS